MDIVTRKEAKERGLKWYYTGKPCINGHVSERRTTTKTCQGCATSPEKKAYKKKYREDNKESVAASKRKWYEENIEHKKDYDKKYYEENKEKKKEQGKQNYLSNRAPYLERSREQYYNNREDALEYRRNYDKENRGKRASYLREKYAKDENFRITCMLRGYLTRTLNASGKSKEHSTEVSVGYTRKELKQSIEDKMLEGMTWDNMDGTGWNLDHLCPISRYIGMGIEDPKIVNHLDNLAPMWAEHNLSKGSKTLQEWLSEKGEASEEYRLYGHYLDRN